MKSVLQKISVSLIFLLGACAHHRDVRPGEDGVHRVVLMTTEKEPDGREGLSQAEDYCETLGKHPAVVSEGTQYVGSMEEGSYNAVKTGAKVAKTVGGFGHVFGGKKESEAGGVVGLGGIVADGAIGNGYKYEMKFKCQ